MLLDTLSILPCRDSVRILLLFFLGSSIAGLQTLQPCNLNLSRKTNAVLTLLYIISFVLFFYHIKLLQSTKTGNLDLIYFSVFGAFLIWGALNLSAIKKFLENPLLVFLGNISFALYAIHMIIFGSFTIWILKKYPNITFLPLYFISLILCILIAIPLSKIDILWVKLLTKIDHQIKKRSKQS